MMLEGHDLTIGYPDRVVGVGLDVKLAKGEVLAASAAAYAPLALFSACTNPW